MRGALRYALVWTMTVALIASAAAWRQCTTVQLAALAVASDQAAAKGHAMHDHQAAHDHHNAMHDRHVPAAPAADDHGCMSCCSMCTVAGATLPAAVEAVTFTASPVAFFCHHEDWRGNTIAVDPGIPKRIA